MVIWLATDKTAVTWDPVAEEHRFHSTNTQRAAIHYPTPLFITRRLELAAEFDIAGVALWELGQAMAILLDAL